MREGARAKIRVIVKRILNKHAYPDHPFRAPAMQAACGTLQGGKREKPWKTLKRIERNIQHPAIDFQVAERCPDGQ